MRAVWPTVAFMQRRSHRSMAGSRVRERSLRFRNGRSPQPSRPAVTRRSVAYRLRVRNDDDPRQVWATYIKGLMRASGLSGPALAKRLGADPSTVWRWETGKQKPESPAMPEAIANLFQVDLDEVLTAAGLVPISAPPVEQPPEPDEERELIMSSGASPRMKAIMLARLEELRRQDEARIEQQRRLDKERRMETLRFMLERA